MPAALLPAVFLLDEFFSDMFFVALVMTGAYLLYILYMNFHDQPMLFAIAAIAGATFLLSNSLLTMGLVALFFIFVVAGMNFQQILMFSVYPLLQMFGFNVSQYGPVSEEEARMMRLQEVEQRILKGEEVSAAEKSALAESYQQRVEMEQRQQQFAQQMLRRR
jgi:hypothetical protein